MMPLEAKGAIENARKLEYTLSWNQEHKKGGKSGTRYESYKATSVHAEESRLEVR